jgi:hypothetical protein
MSWYLVSEEDLEMSRLHGYFVLLCMFRRRRSDEIGHACFRVFRLAPS